MNQKRQQLDLEDDNPALVIFDVFKGQCTEEVLKMIDDNHIERVVVPAHCTDQLQPLELSVNKLAKEFLRRKFQEWFADQIAAQLEDGTQQVNTQQVDMRLSITRCTLACRALQLPMFQPLLYCKWSLCNWYLGHPKRLIPYSLTLYSTLYTMLCISSNLFKVMIHMYVNERYF